MEIRWKFLDGKMKCKIILMKLIAIEYEKGTLAFEHLGIIVA